MFTVVRILKLYSIRVTMGMMVQQCFIIIQNMYLLRVINILIMTGNVIDVVSAIQAAMIDVPRVKVMAIII
jgi:hypothetical protein